MQNLYNVKSYTYKMKLLKKQLSHNINTINK